MNRRELLAGGLGLVVTGAPARTPQASLQYMGLLELTRLLHRKELSPVEVVKAQLARIAALDNTLHGFVRTTPDLALEQARLAEKAILAGDIKGPLHGAPFGIKDIIWTRDAVTAAGSSRYASYRPPENATCVERLFAAGAVMLGKLTTTEFAGATYDPSVPMPVNPWNRTLWPGASSSGAGVALAAGLCYGALGTDSGGSVRFPAALEGVVGFKPTHGRISIYGIFNAVPSMDHIGPMARTVEDVAAIYLATAGFDTKDTFSSRQHVEPFTLVRKEGLRGLKVGLDPEFTTRDVDDATRAVLEATTRTLTGLGATLVTMKLPDMSRLYPTISAVMDKEGVDYKGATPAAPVAVAPDDTKYLEAVAWRASFARQVAALLDRVDVLLTPVVPSAALPVAGMEKLETDPALFERTLRYTVPFDLTGSPALVLPAGINAAGGPISVQLVAQRFREDTLLQVGQAFEQATRWHEGHPPL
jgi:amidase